MTAEKEVEEDKDIVRKWNESWRFETMPCSSSITTLHFALPAVGTVTVTGPCLLILMCAHT